MKEKLIPGQVLYASKGIAWKKATIVGIVSYIKDGFFSLAGPRLSKSFWRN